MRRVILGLANGTGRLRRAAGGGGGFSVHAQALFDETVFRDDRRGGDGAGDVRSGAAAEPPRDWWMKNGLDEEWP